MKRQLLLTLLIAGITIQNSSIAGLFGRIRERTQREVEKAVDDAIDNTVNQTADNNKPEQQQEKQSTASNPSNEDASVQTIHSVEDLYGQWQGLVTPAGQGSSLMAGMTLYITITPEFESMRVSGAGTQCLAELEPTDTLGQYHATFIDQNQQCGSRATLQFASGGNVTIDWTDMPDTSDSDRTYTGQLNRTVPYARRWSTSQDQRDKLDIVGLRLGMTYEQALDYLRENHPDLDQTLKIITDAGTRSLVLNMTENTARKLGPVVFGEQLTLVFESQTPDEMEVEQDPEVLAAIEEREQIIQQRNEQLAQQRRSRRTRTAASGAEPQTALPEIPEQPQLRPDGADAQLVVISRQIQYSNRRGPAPDNVLSAMTNKYGPASIEIKKPGSAGETYLTGWVWNADGDYMPDAKGTACDLLSVTGYDLKAKAHYYSVLNSAVKVFFPVSVSPHCGLTLVSQIQTENDGSVWKIVTNAYDQQRLLGDEWYRTAKLDEAMVAEEKAKSSAIKQRNVPDF